MNKKGFTLIELLGVIVLIGLVCAIAVPSMLDYLNTSKREARNEMIGTIKTASKIFYEECLYSDLQSIIKTNPEKYGNCEINDNVLKITIGNLAYTGMLKIDEEDENGNKIVKDPISGKELNDCQIKITRKKETTKDESNDINYNTYKYIIERADNNTKCPDKYGE